MRYILYCRKSSEAEDRQVQSLESQQQELLDLATRLGLDVVKVLHESQSAKAEGRPVFASLISMIQNKEADAILCWKLDRLARNMADAGRVIDLLQRGVIKEIKTNDATHLPSDNVLMLAVQLGMANQYIRDLSENVKRGNKTKLEQGGWPNRAPFGYKNDLATKELVIDETQSLIVRRCFELYASGSYSILDIVQKIFAEGFRTGVSTKIGKSTIERIIKNPFYMGVMLSKGKYYEGKHEPIISKALYEQAEKVLIGTTHPKGQTLLFPLRGLLVCANCTCQYTATLKKGHQYYYCTNGKSICEAHSKYLRSEAATQLISNALGEVKMNRELIEIAYEAKREQFSDNYSYTEAIQKRLQSQLHALERQEIKAFEDSSAGLLRQELYEQVMIKIKNSRMLLKKELSELKLQNGILTLEPVRDAFMQGYTAQTDFLTAYPETQKQIASKVLWNLLVKDGETQEVRYKMPYAVMANAPKNANLEIMLRD